MDMESHVNVNYERIMTGNEDTMLEQTMNGVDVSMVGERDAAIWALEDILSADERYIKRTEECVCIFNKLKDSLTDEQKKLLFQYDGAVALKERTIVDILSERALQ